MMSIPEIERLLQDVEMAARIPRERGGIKFAQREREDLAAIREKFDDRIRRGSVRPLSEAQVETLRRYWDRI